MYGERVIIKPMYCNWTPLQCSAAAVWAFSSWQTTWLLSYHNKYFPLEKASSQWRLEQAKLEHTQAYGRLDLIFGRVSLFTASVMAGVLPHLLSESSTSISSSRTSQQVVQCLSHYSVFGQCLFPIHHFSHHLQLGTVILPIWRGDFPRIFWSSAIARYKTPKAYRLPGELVRISWYFF